MVVWEALDALSHQLELCKIDSTSRVVLLLDDSTDSDQAALLRAAVARTRADAIEIRPLHNPSGDTSLITYLTIADVVITTIHDDELLDAALGGVDAVLRVHSDLAPERFPPHASMRRRVDTLHRDIHAATTLWLTDAQGSEVEVTLDRAETNADHGIVDDDCRMASFPAGWVSVVPNKLSVRGELVLMPGDSNLAARRVLSSPLRLEIENDLITLIDGDSPDADVVRALLENPHETDAYGIAEISVGMNPAPTPLDLFDPQRTVPHLARLLGGMITVSFGDNLIADRPCSQTISFALPRRTLRADDVPIVTNGLLEGDFAPDVYELG